MGILYSTLAMIILFTISYFIYDETGFYNKNSMFKNLVEFSVHFLILSHFVLVVFYSVDWKKINDLQLRVDLQDQNILDYSQSRIRGLRFIAFWNMVLRLGISIIIITFTMLLFIVVVYFAWVEVGFGWPLITEDIILILLIVLFLIGSFIPLSYHLKINSLQRALEIDK